MQTSEPSHKSSPSEVSPDGVRYVCFLHRKIPARYVFLVAALLEFCSLEIVADGQMHHWFNAGIFVAYGFLMRVLDCSSRLFAAYCFCTAVAWGMDILHIHVPVVDVEGFAWLASHALLAICLTLSLRHVTRVTKADIAGSVSLYIMVGIVFANIYRLLLEWFPAGLTSTHTKTLQYGEILYFSMVTQLTIGYGDIVPVAPVFRVVTVFQAIFGVMCVSILISWMVSSYIASHNRNDSA